PISSMQSDEYLAMLANVASGDYTLPSPSSDHDSFESLHIPSSSVSSSLASSERPLRRSSTSNAPHTKVLHKASGKFDKVLSLPRSQDLAREDKTRRQKRIKAVIEQVCALTTVLNITDSLYLGAEN